MLTLKAKLFNLQYSKNIKYFLILGILIVLYVILNVMFKRTPVNYVQNVKNKILEVINKTKIKKMENSNYINEKKTELKGIQNIENQKKRLEALIKFEQNL